jgi:hypothetical protein
MVLFSSTPLALKTTQALPHLGIYPVSTQCLLMLLIPHLISIPYRHGGECVSGVADSNRQYHLAAHRAPHLFCWKRHIDVASWAEGRHGCFALAAGHRLRTLPGAHRFQISLRSRGTAMPAGLRTLIQTRHGPDWQVPSPLFDTMLSAPSRHAWAKTVGPSSATCLLSRMPALMPPRRRVNAALR